MKQIKELHEKHNRFPEYKHFYLVHSYDRELKIWEFRGYRCTKCNKVLQRNVNGVPNHFKVCREINKTKSYKTQEIDPKATVLDVNGIEWKPLEINQK